MTPLRAAIGHYPHTAALFDDPAFAMEKFPVISRAFAPMVRDKKFDVSEMAIATLLMAREAGSDLVLLPVVMAARPQTGALLRQANDQFGPGDLRGKRIGVRAYSQTTGMWLRGMLADAYGLQANEAHWVTFEDAHVAGYRDPPWTERAPAGSDMLAMLRDGALDAAIFGNEVPDAADLAPVYPDPAGAGRDFRTRHGFDPVNHLVVARAELAGLQALCERLRRNNPYPSGRPALDPAITLAIRYMVGQNLLRRTLTLDEVWAGPKQ